MLQLFHLIPIFLLYTTQFQYKVMHFETNNNHDMMYYACCLLGILITVFRSKQHLPLEDLVKLISFICIQKIITFSLDDEYTKDIIHATFIANMLIALKYNVLPYKYIKLVYLGAICFSIFPLISKKLRFVDIMNDYAVVHLLFFLMKDKFNV